MHLKIIEWMIKSLLFLIKYYNSNWLYLTLGFLWRIIDEIKTNLKFLYIYYENTILYF